MLSLPQRDRLAYIELKVWFTGFIQRQDVVVRFGVQTAAATRDLALYKELAPNNISYDQRAKTYVLLPGFEPIFEFSAERVLSWLTKNFGEGAPHSASLWIQSEIPARLTHPDLRILASITRAVVKKSPLSIVYHSVRDKRSQREIVPFALVDTGLRWHVRAFDRKSQEFRDFVITRVEQPVVMSGAAVESHENSDQDIQWNRIVELELVPHPDQPCPEITVMDYRMQDRVLRIKLRAATAGYILRKWSVDCSPDHSLRGHEYRLWLKNHLSLYGVKNAVLAPGYRSPDQQQLDADLDE